VRISRATWSTTIVLFSILVAHALLETARDALFLAKLSPNDLALAYLAIAATALVAVTATRRWLGVLDPRRMLIGFLVLAVIGTSVLAITITWASWLVFVLYVWTGFVATLVVPCFWTVVDRSVLVSEAKRMFATIGAGGVLGALVGSAIAAAVGHVLPPRHLVTLGAGVFALATLAAVVLAPHPIDRPVPRRPSFDVRASSKRSRRYVQLLLAIGLISTITLTVGDLTFKRALAERLPPEQLATAFGTIYTGLNIVGLIVQLAIAPRLLARVGVGAALMLLPAIMVMTSLGFVLTGTTIAVIALKLGDGGLRHSLHRVASEILYLPVPAAIRDASKPIADALSHRGGQALAAIIVFIAISIDDSLWTLAWLTVVGGLAWLGSIWFARHAYIAQFREMLRAGEVQRDVRVPELDGSSAQLLAESLSSPDEVEALAALDLLAHRPRNLPALVLYHPRKLVVQRALGLLEGELRADVARVLEYLLSHPDPEIRADALAASHRTGDHRPAMVAALTDAHPEVRAAALVGLVDDAELAIRVAAGVEMMQRGTMAERIALAHAIGLAPRPAFRDTLAHLLASREPAVLREVLEAYARAPSLAPLDKLLPLLEEAHVRGVVRQVFLASGARGLERLVLALDDPATPRTIRRHIPRTISRFRTEAAAAALVQRLLHEADGSTEFKLLRALGRMRTDDPTLAIDATVLRRYARRAVSQAARYATLHDRLASEPELSRGALLLLELLAEKRRNAVEHAFRAFGILYPDAHLRSVHDSMTSPDDVRRSAAREIFESIVPAELRVPLLAVIEDLPAEERRARLGTWAPGPFTRYEDFVADVLADPSESLRCVVAHHVAERRLITLRPELQRLRPIAGSELVLHAFDQAIARLDVGP